MNHCTLVCNFSNNEVQKKVLKKTKSAFINVHKLFEQSSIGNYDMKIFKFSAKLFELLPNFKKNNSEISSVSDYLENKPTKLMKRSTQNLNILNSENHGEQSGLQ